MTHFVDPARIRQAVESIVIAANDGSVDELAAAASRAERALPKLGHCTARQTLNTHYLSDLIRSVLGLPKHECDARARDHVLGSPLELRLQAVEEHMAMLKRKRTPRPEAPAPVTITRKVGA